MASVDTDNRNQDEIETALQSDTAVDSLADAVAQIAVLEDTETSDHSTHESPGRKTRPFRSYTRAQILYLAYSPLVQPPHDMPPLKEWFGDWNEQLITAKKDPETSGTSLSARDRRFRRELDDGENPKQSFRATLSQPSQMGNFRHQSLRTNDRDKDRDLERERERDLRDKEGQERLRNLSDKYDRDRLALSTSSNIRTKERDSAPHLMSGATSRLGQTQNSSTTSRRNETRDVPKRKVGESSEDWRRGSEPARSNRDDRSDNPRRDRERPRSRARESSRTRREPSSTRRDRDERDRERERLRDRRGDGDRDDLRRDKEEYSRRERDDSRRREWDDFYNRSDRDREDVSQRDSRGKYRPKDSERDSEEDPRRWNDDGKRDERIATRRERERERVWDRYDERDRERPNGSDDRDTRSRRGVGRERRPGGAGDDSKDNDDRRDRNREAEPAWMETYVPSTSGGGILGGKSGDGELDGIQAWKKGMKEKERLQRENSASLEATQKPEAKQANSASTAAPQDFSNTPENQLDEIQIFKQMMKREADKKENEKQSTASPEPGPQMGPTLSRAQSFASVFMLEQLTTGNDERAASNSHPSQGTAESQQSSSNGRSRISSGQQLPAGLSSLSRLTISQGEGQQSFMSVLASSASRETASPTNLGNTTIQSAERSSDGQQPIVSHVTPSIPSATVSSSQLSDFSSLETSASASSAASVFNPPAGSRLLAFGSRSTPGPDALSSKLQPTLDSSISQLPPPGLPGLTAQKSTAMPPSMPNLSLLAESAGLDAHFMTNARRTPTDSARGFRSFSPHGNLVSSSATFDNMHEEMSIGQLNDLRRASAVERAAFGLPNETVAPYADMVGTQGGPASYSPSNSVELGGNVPGAANYASGKGSRFAKFFDSKARDAALVGGGRKAPGPPGYVSNSPHPDLRQPGVGLNGTNGTPGDTRTMEDIFAMLQNSAQQQSHRVSPQIPSAGRMASIAYGQNHPDLHNLQQPIHSQHQFAQNSQFDSLYDSRLDDRNFVPDGMVPGLRPAPPRSRSREASGVLFNEQLDDPLHFNVRLQQQRNLEQMFSGSVSSVYSQQQAAMMRNGGLPLQQPQFRGAPSPILNQNPLGPQRLPPGLANLGGRPPHDPSQYLGGPMGGLGGGLQSGLHSGTASQQSFNNYGGNGGALGFGGGPQIRSPSGPQGPLAVNSMAGLGIQNNMDLRAANQAHLLGLSGGSVGGGLRGQVPGFGPHHVPSGQPSVSHLAMRQQQQQQQQLPPHLMSHLLPPHLQQQQGLPGGNVQGAQDLMALLMGGHRD